MLCKLLFLVLGLVIVVPKLGARLLLNGLVGLCGYPVGVVPPGETGVPGDTGVPGEVGDVSIGEMDVGDVGAVLKSGELVLVLEDVSVEVVELVDMEVSRGGATGKG